MLVHINGYPGVGKLTIGRALAAQVGGKLLDNVLSVRTSAINLEMCECKEDSCARLHVGDLARIETRCISAKHDKACGNEDAFYPPLSKSVQVRAAVAVEHSYKGKEFNETWKDHDRRGAYVGSFEMK